MIRTLLSIGLDRSGYWERERTSRSRCYSWTRRLCRIRLHIPRTRYPWLHCQQLWCNTPNDRWSGRYIGHWDNDMMAWTHSLLWSVGHFQEYTTYNPLGTFRDTCNILGRLIRSTLGSPTGSFPIIHQRHLRKPARVPDKHASLPSKCISENGQPCRKNCLVDKSTLYLQL